MSIQTENLIKTMTKNRTENKYKAEQYVHNQIYYHPPEGGWLCDMKRLKRH